MRSACWRGVSLWVVVGLVGVVTAGVSVVAEAQSVRPNARVTGGDETKKESSDRHRDQSERPDDGHRTHDRDHRGHRFRHAVPLPVREGDARFVGDFGTDVGDQVGIGVVVVGPLTDGRSVYPGYIVHQTAMVDLHGKKSRLRGDSATLELSYYSRLTRFPWFGPAYGFRIR